MKGKFDTLLYNIGAVVVGLVLSGALLLFLKIDPLAVCSKAIGKIFSDEYTIGEILVKATPLIFTSLAFARPTTTWSRWKGSTSPCSRGNSCRCSAPPDAARRPRCR